ncbi:MAG: tRNA (guanosine(37)-N1)-methyltransferase TrmD [Chloroflexi bacterium RBG_13_68_17]|nr:MAG: tRNA (guanosine(37)-N1)-methyltransferase TrmD [Chloroflexi bacterium RBG_13_68_17]
MRIDVFTILPASMQAYLTASILGKAQVAGLLDVRLHDLRDHTLDRHRTTDDAPYGGGGGMVMKPEPIFAAVERALGEAVGQVPILLLSPQGRLFDQKLACALAAQPQFALICGRYEGVDERVCEHLATDEISIGDFVLTGGELPAMVVIDAVARLIPGVLGDEGAAENDSHAAGLLEYPHYTRPPDFRGWQVPEILLSGDHARVAAWRREQSLRRTRTRRPDMLADADLNADDRRLLQRIAHERADPDDPHRP